jgi:hypothetical protein
MRQIDKFSKSIDKMFAEKSVTKAQLLDAFHKANPDSLSLVNILNIPIVSQQSELLLSAICQFTKRNTQKEIQEVERWIETDFRK